ncbi:glycerate kinase isoform X2 [Pseudomyrmex gracilis]|nr:glycerate kinase isoform X2 [Pseudomyrmex gracilis]
MATNAKFASEVKSDLKDIFRAAVKAVSPNEIVRRKVKFRDNTLYINEKSFHLRENVYLVGFGKAVMGMAQEFEKLLGNVLKKGIVSVPSVSKDAVWTSEDPSDFPKLHNSVIDYREGGVNNQPDVRSLNTTHDIIDLVENLKDTDTLIVLISGGGSALLYMPRPVLDQDDKLELCKKLQNAGADITELNTVRKKLSLVKGGGVARMAYPASVITLILSDIVGDPVDLIASGPTVYSAKAPENVIAILKKYHLYESLDSNLKKFLSSKETFRDTRLLTRAKQFKHVTNIILGNNTTALEAASLEALRKKWTPIILKNDITGNVQDVSLAYARVASLICLFWSKELEREVFYDRMRTVPALPLTVDKIDEIFHCITNNFDGLLLIGGGEPTVVVRGQGKGGRNQELALRFSLDWLAEIKSYPQLVDFDVIILSGGTDGQDGPTDAAGAFGYPAIAPIVHDLYAEVKSTIDRNILTRDQCKTQQMSVSNTKLHGQKNLNTTEVSTSATGDSNQNLDCSVLTLMEVERMLPENTLKENDTYNFYSRFKKGEDLIKTGITGTNVMDLHLIYIKKRRCRCEHELKSLDKSESKTDGLDAHDLHIDKTTIEKYKTIRASSKSVEDFLQTLHLTVKTEENEPFLNIKIIDDSFTEPCCNKKKT